MRRLHAKIPDRDLNVPDGVLETVDVDIVIEIPFRLRPLNNK